MKILFITNVPAPYRVAFFNALGKLCKLSVAFCGKSASDRHKSWENFKIYSFEALFLKTNTDYKKHKICWNVLKYLKKPWNLIVICGYSAWTNRLAIEYMRLRKIPFYLEVDGGVIRQDSKIKFWFKKHFISAASGWFSSGKETTKYLVHYGAKPEKIYEYPFSSLSEADILPQVPSQEQKQTLRKQLGISENKVIISVGRFSYQKGYGKGYDILMKVSEVLPSDIGVYIIGDNPTQEFIDWKKNKKLERVHFVGFQSKEELQKWYQVADAFVLPTREDIWGLVINEAMSQGLPVITTDKCVAGLELVKNGVNGYIVPVGNVQELANAITKVFAQDYYLMGQKSLEIIQPYTIENMAMIHWKELSKCC